MSALAIPAAVVSTEISSTLRTAFDCTLVTSARVQAWVDSPVTGAKITLKYSLDSGTTWANASAGGTGPYVSVALAGDRRGVALNLIAAAKADVLLSLFVSGGDGATDLVLGNCGVLVYVRTEEGDEVVIPELSGCAIEAGFSSESFVGSSAALTTLEEWLADRAWLPNDNPPGYGIVREWFGKLLTQDSGYAYIDVLDRFNGNPTLAGVYRSDDPDGMLAAGMVGYFDYTHAGRADFTAKLVFKIPTDFDITGLAALGWDAPDNGLIIMQIGISDAPGGASGGVDGWLSIQEGRLVFTTDLPSAVPVVNDLGPSTLAATDEWMQLLWRVEFLSDTSVRMSLYLDTACPGTPTLLYQETLAVVSTSTRGVREVYVWNWGMDQSNINPSPRTVHTAQLGATYTASDYGI